MRLLRRWSIRARITLGSALIGALVIAGLAIVLHVQVRQATVQTQMSLAAGDAAPFISDLMHNPDEAPDRPAHDVLIGIRDPDGRWIRDTLPAAVRAQLPHAPRGDEQVLQRRIGDAVYTIIGYRVDGPAGEHQVWVAHDGRGGDLTVMTVDRSLVVGAVLAVLAFAATAWLLATLALRPVARMRRTAERLSTGQVDEHLPVGPSVDELSDLATTLNAFLDRQREQSARERRMISDASHELRTPLAALNARLELAHRSFGDADALEREIIDAQVDSARLTSLATTLLELSRLDDDRSAPESSLAASIVTELMDGVDRARALAGAASLDVDFDVRVPDQTATYRISPAAFGRIVDNLIGNAIAFSPTAGMVRVVLEQDDRRTLTLRVTDDGPGVPEAFLPVAFDRFSRADTARRRSGGGSGLGLSLVRGIAEQAGGTAVLANRATGGAEATVSLPTV